MEVVRLKPFDFAQAAARAGLRADGLPLGSKAPAAQAPSFATAMDQALRSVSRSQQEATRMQR